MKKLGLWIIAFFVGELVAIAHKDKQFKKTLQKKEGMDRRKYIFQSLFNFNKELVQSAPEIDIKNIKKRANEEYALLTTKVEDLEKNLHDRSEEKVMPHLEEAQARFEELKAKAKQYSEEVDLDDKLVMIKQKIDTIKKKIKA